MRKPDGQDEAGRWIHAGHTGHRIPEQGWKLHISASCLDAERVLEAILPVLLAEPVAFKLTSTLSVLEWVNSGGGGLSQIGKFVTVYPADDRQAVALAAALHQVTAGRGLRGAPVPSDRPLAPGSLVHYRFGAFRSQWIRTPIGEWRPALRTPAGDLVPDRRETAYSAPDWVTDPFAAAGLVTAPSPAGQVLADRYVLIAMMHYSPRGALHLALDAQSATTCVVKTAWPHAAVDRHGRDARDRLVHEAHMLGALSPVAAIPRLIDSDPDHPFLVMEDLAGETLEQWAARRRADGARLAASEFLPVARQLARVLAELHERDVVYRDLKSANVMVTPDGRVRLLDFELAYELGSGSPPFGGGTRGYMSPNQAVNGEPAFGDDIHAFGAVLYYLATGGEPSWAPDASNLLTRPVGLLNPDAAGLAPLIARCLGARPGQPAAWKLARALDGFPARTRPRAVPSGRRSRAPAGDVYRALARQLGDGLCAAARPGDEGRLEWRSAHPLAAGRSCWDLNVGSAGPLLALARLAGLLCEPRHRDVVAQVASDEAGSPRWTRGPRLPGLFVGEAGAALALLAAGQMLGDDALVAAASTRSAWIAGQAHQCPDMFNGTAGRVRFHLHMWAATGDPGELAAAEDGGRYLLAAAQADGGTASWPIPPGYGSLSGIAHTGYAHGAAGIADALLDLYEATGRRGYADAAAAGGRWLAGLAAHTPDGLSLPTSAGQPPGGAAWCRGAAGAGRFLLHAARLGILPPAAGLARAAADTTAVTGRAGTPTLCHGLAGQIDLLTTASRQFGGNRWAVPLTELARLLQAFLYPGPGGLACCGEDPEVPTPDLMVGTAGVALAFLDLAELAAPSGSPAAPGPLAGPAGREGGDA